MPAYQTALMKHSEEAKAQVLHKGCRDSVQITLAES